MNSDESGPHEGSFQQLLNSTQDEDEMCGTPENNNNNKTELQRMREREQLLRNELENLKARLNRIENTPSMESHREIRSSKRQLELNTQKKTPKVMRFADEIG
jgi:hypothetical protein